MRKGLCFISMLFVLSAIFISIFSSGTVFASEPLFDLSRTDYFDNAHFSFIQTVTKRKNPSGSHGRRFMPGEGEVWIDFKSNKKSDNYEIVTLSKKDDELLYRTELTIDRFGITKKYIMYDPDGKAIYSYGYDVYKQKAFIEYLDEEGEIKRNTVAVEKETYSMMTIPYIVGAATIEGNERRIMKAVVGDGRFFELYIQKINKEKISVRHRAFTCRKIECGFTGIIGLFVPKMIFWVDETTLIPVKQDMMGGSIIELGQVYD